MFRDICKTLEKKELEGIDEEEHFKETLRGWRLTGNLQGGTALVHMPLWTLDLLKTKEWGVLVPGSQGLGGIAALGSTENQQTSQPRTQRPSHPEAT